MTTETKPKDMKEALKSVMEHLLDLADTERKKSKPYKDMFKASEHGLKGLLDDANDKMEGIILDVMAVIKERTGQEVDRELFYFLQCLPFFRDRIEQHISANDGFSCSVDKARELAKDYALKELAESARKKNDMSKNETQIDISEEHVGEVNVEPDGWCAWHPERGWFNDNICGVDVPDLYGSKADAMEVLGCTEVWTVRPVWLSTTPVKKEANELD